ncbi:ABC transporter ATP-binding protein [candidate division WWE3 bacterium]|nr:ABC transporter ATP-binding protein [candidate division WWE3 bacterium]
MNTIIEITRLKKNYGHIPAVQDVSLSVERGEIFGFLGPNGAGKTTTIRCMMDLVRPDQGDIEILGMNAHTQSVRLKNKVGFLPAELNLFEHWTGWDHIKFAATDNTQIDKINELINTLEYHPELPIRKLSTGNKQKLGFILAMVKNPSVLILDEPTSGLDPLLQHRIYQILTDFIASGNTVFMSSHNLSEVEKLCTRIGIIRQGTIVAVEEISSMKKKTLFSVQIYFKETPPTEQLTTKNCEIVQTLPNNGLALSVKSDIDQFLNIIRNYAINDIQINHATLDEVFMKYYT